MPRPWFAPFVALIAAATPAWAATTVAVLPLERAAGSAEHAGLGTALAGMLVADLSGIEGLTLVERTRLDAVLDEIELGGSGFVDPATAQRLGQGLGAQTVVMGSWSVVGDAFLLDVRLVDVESSRILKAATADGAVGDFVAVEKEVAEALIDGLAVTLDTAARRRFMVETPTESFPALAAYGEGLAAADAGRLDDAAGAFERALGADPAFDEARAELTAVRARVESMRAEDTTRAITDRERRLMAVLAGTTDERTVAARHRDDLDDLARWGLRLKALDELGRHCERYEEMRHFLDRRRGDVDLPPETSRPFVLVERLSEHAWALGLEEKERPTDTYSRDMRIQDGASILANPQRFVLSTDVHEPGHPSSEGLWHSLTECLPPETHLGALEKLRRNLRDFGVTTEEFDSAGVPFEDVLEGFELRVRAQRSGADAALEARVTALLDAHQDGPGRSWATTLASRVVDDAVARERHRAMRQGLPEDVLLGMGRALVAEDPDRLALSAPGCTALVERGAPEAATALAQYEDQLDDRPQYAPWTLSRLGVVVAPLLDFGCFVGIPGRFESPEEAAAWLDAGRGRARSDRGDDPTCTEAWTALGDRSWSDEVGAASPEMSWHIVHSGLSAWYARLEGGLCVVPSRGGP